MAGRGGGRDRVMDAAGVDRATAWGYSRGAGLAAAVAAEFPDRVAALILTGGGDLTPAAIADTAPSPVIDAMYRGDFGPLWDEYSFSAEDRRYDQGFNNPRALGAMAIAERRSNFAIDFDRIAALPSSTSAATTNPTRKG